MALEKCTLMLLSSGYEYCQLGCGPSNETTLCCLQWLRNKEKTRREIKKEKGEQILSETK